MPAPSGGGDAPSAAGDARPPETPVLPRAPRTRRRTRNHDNLLSFILPIAVVSWVTTRRSHVGCSTPGCGFFSSHMHQATADATASENATTVGAMSKIQTRIASAATASHTAPQVADRETGMLTSATNRSPMNTATECHLRVGKDVPEEALKVAPARGHSGTLEEVLRRVLRGCPLAWMEEARHDRTSTRGSTPAEAGRPIAAAAPGSWPPPAPRPVSPPLSPNWWRRGTLRRAARGVHPHERGLESRGDGSKSDAAAGAAADPRRRNHRPPPKHTSRHCGRSWSHWGIDPIWIC